MKTMFRRLLKRLMKEDSGQDLVEYALLIVLIGLLMISSVNIFAGKLAGVFSEAGTQLQQQVPGTTPPTN